MKAEYTHDQDHVNVGNKNWLNPRPIHEDQSSETKPLNAPYIWHVKDEEPPAMKKRVQGRMRAPYFYNDLATNKAYLNNTFEVWLSPGHNAGAKAHNDGYCNSVFSVQLNGAKRWRLMQTPAFRSVFDSFDEFDGGIFEAEHLKWEPQYDFYNPEGGGVLFPPGYMHETRGQAECTISYFFFCKCTFSSSPNRWNRIISDVLKLHRLKPEENADFQKTIFHV